MTVMAIGGSDMAALATLMLDVDEARAAANDQELRAAHQAQRQELDRQVQELHDAASDMRWGAGVEGGIGLAGDLASIAGTACAPAHPADCGEQAQTLGVAKAAAQANAAFAGAKQPWDDALAIGKALSTMAKPTSALAFGASEKDAEARAKQHEALAADAGARMTEAEHHHDRVLDEEERTLGTLQSTLQTASDGNLAIIANA